MSLNIQTALHIWTFDKGYRTINSFLIGSKSPADYKYHQENNDRIEYNHNTYNTKDVIDLIKSNMVPSDKAEIYFRGDTQQLQYSSFKKSFISVTKDEEQAKSFIDDGCCLYKVIVDDSVKRCNTGVENEVLLENNLYWNYLGPEDYYYLVRISKQPMEIKIEPIIEKKNEAKEELTQNELYSLFNNYKEEATELEDEITPEGFIAYIEYYIKNRNKMNISHEKAKELIMELYTNSITSRGGMKRTRTKKNKHKRSKTNKKSKKRIRKLKRGKKHSKKTFSK